jgi:acyl dehydratase
MTTANATPPAVGDILVSKTFAPISRTTLALYAGASGDHNPMHIDIDFAKRAGFPDVFAQGMLVMGYLGRALTDAVRLDQLRSFSTRFTAITQLGAMITCEGKVAELLDANGEKRARLALTARDENGEVKLSGEAIVAL